MQPTFKQLKLPCLMHSDYRQDIDGMRAVAILSVLGFHVKSNWVPGGFVGVDVFFVISGYLISGIILRGLKQETFSFAEFYSRRIKRIFPALSAVLIFVLTVGWCSLYTDEFEQLGKHIAAGATFVSNFTLWKEAGYFDRTAELKPLLHLWSLGIEEQFYIVWPLLLYLAWKRGFNLLAVIGSIGLVSFCLNVGRIAGHPTSTFYLPVPRFWELLMGGALAYAQVFEQEVSQSALTSWLGAVARPERALIQHVMSSIGVVLIGIAVTCLSRNDLFPGWRALLPTLGTFLLIAAGPKAWANRTILSTKFMTFVGLISYPLYLWHWPLISFERIIPSPTTVKVVSLGLVFVLAWLTYRFIERPIRSSPFKLRPALQLVLMVACVGIVGYLSFLQWILPRSSGYGLDKLIAASVAMAYPGPRLTSLGGNYDDLLQQGEGSTTVLFLGDSHIEQYYPRIDRLLINNPLGTKRVVYCASGGCPPLPNVQENHHPYCHELFQHGMEFARSPQVDTIVIGANWLSYFVDPDRRYSYYLDDGVTKTGFLINTLGADKAFAAIENMIADFVRHGKKVFIILQIPSGEAFDPRHMIKRRLGSLDFPVEIPTVNRQAIEKHAREVVSRLRTIAERTGANVIDPMPWLCDDTACLTVTPDGEPTHKDWAHLNPFYVADHVHFLDQILSIHSKDRNATSHASDP
jgi:peptidoglycan/LPS O-acetylase OafA/YrhL